MIKAFIKIRLNQISRYSRSLGLLRFVVIAGCALFPVYKMFMKTVETESSLYVIGICFLILLIIQTKRSDKGFLKINFLKYRLVMITEYLILSIPLFFCLAFHNQWLLFISFIVLIVIVSNIDIKTRQRSLNTFFQKLIPSDCFEWKSGIRRSFFYIIPLWLIGMGTSFFVGSIPLVLFILGLIPLGFYEKGEPLQMILSFERNSHRFLFYKISLQTAVFSVLSFPLILVFVLFHPGLWYIPIIEFVIYTTIHIYTILTKYAFYSPGIKISGAQVFEIIGALGIFFPFLLPLILLLSVRFYIKSKKNLNLYLDDYH